MCGQHGYVTLASLGVVSTKFGYKFRCCYLHLATFGAHQWAKYPLNPCHFRLPRVEHRDKTKSTYLNHVFSGAHTWEMWLHEAYNPLGLLTLEPAKITSGCVIRGPKRQQSGYITLAITGSHKCQN